MKIVLFLLMFCFANCASAANLRVFLGDTGHIEQCSFAPYSIVTIDPEHPNQLQISGVAHDFLAEVIKLTGDTIEYVRLPAVRALPNVSEGKIDLELFANPAWRTKHSEGSIYTIAYLKSYDYYVFPKDKVFRVMTFTDLVGKHVDLIRGYGYDTALMNHIGIKRSESVNEIMMLKKLSQGIVDVGVINADIYAYQTKQLGINNLVLGDLYSPPADVSMRFNAKHQEVVERFNVAIARLIKDGTLSRIGKKYGLNL
ncbi:MAG: transporter substrate-binding domain-containing protein [Burkholderiaceae bacterium]|nr:transporter substrate-binding domain-containing protein [Burkholderiaceae bacterium]